MIKDCINSLLNSEHLSLTNAREVFDEILSGLSSDILTSSFITALKFNEPSEDEILACIMSSNDAINRPNTSFNSSDSMHNLVINNKEKFINISFVQDIICSANNLASSKFSYDTNNDINFLTLKALGADFDSFLDFNSNDFEELNFAYLPLNQSDAFYKYSKNIFNNLSFNHIFNIAYKFLNPLNNKNLSIGVDKIDDVEKYANLAIRLNYDNAVVFSSDNDFPFISTFGKTFVAEAWKNKIFTYVLTPDLLEIKNTPLESLYCESIEQSSQEIKEIFSGKLKNGKYDFAVLNAGISLYIAKKADSVMDGFDLARKTIDDGLALEKLNQIIKFYS